MNILKSILILLIVAILLAAAFVFSGVYNVAADEPHAAITEWVLGVTRSRSIAARLDEVEAPGNLDNEQRIARGGELYGSNCAGCHLGPGMKPTGFHKGLNPKPPRLTAHGGHHPASEQFWVIKHGIKMSGMPAWGESMNDEALWDITAFVLKMPDMSADDFKRFTQGAPEAG